MCDLCVKKTMHSYVKGQMVIGIIMFTLFCLSANQGFSFNTELFGEPLAIKGYVNQSAQFGIAGDQYDTKQGFQQGILQALLELEYTPTSDIKVFTSGLLYKDWAYNIYKGNSDWENRRFDEAQDEMSLHNDYEDMLKECHISWAPEGFNVRVGKQIVSWGEMDGVRIMDQINPKDVRIGPSDVEFETSIIPIWLAKVVYYPDYKPDFLMDLGLEFTFNPNADFLHDKIPGTGNYVNGIWGVNSFIPSLNGRVGAIQGDYDEPNTWSDGHEYAIRLMSTLQDGTRLTLNFFKGVEDTPVIMPDSSRTGGSIDSIYQMVYSQAYAATYEALIGYGYDPATAAAIAASTAASNAALYSHVPGLNGTTYYDDKGRQIIEPYMKGYYPDKKFAGFTCSKELESLYIGALGGVAPVLRCEALYEFDTTFTYNNLSNPYAPMYDFEQHDAIFWGIAMDWKFKVNLINERRYISLVPQFTHRYIRDYPSAPNTYLQNVSGSIVSENNYSFSVRMDTWYMNDKIQPFIYYQRDIRSDVSGITDGSVKADLWLLALTYAPNSTWSYKVQATFLDGAGWDKDRGMGNKDNICFTVKYQF